MRSVVKLPLQRLQKSYKAPSKASSDKTSVPRDWLNQETPHRAGAQILRYRLLGPIEVVNDESNAVLGGPKKRGLLALLLLHANEPISTEKLIDSLWAEHPPLSARAIVQSYVSQLRKLLHRDATNEDSAILQTRSGGYLLKVGSGELDLDDFLQLTDEGRAALRAGRFGRASSKLGAALSLVYGSPLADLTTEPFAQSHIARLQELVITATEDRAEADLALGRYSEVIANLDIAIAEHPLRERLRELLMLALYRTGRQAEALNVFRDTRAHLVDELGIEPSRGLQDLQARILAEDPALLDSQTEREVHGNLGAPFTTFVGREPELEELRKLVRKERLITLNGIGGVGKSRLAIELGASVSDWFPDGVWIIQLAALSDEALIPHTVATVLDIREQPDQQMLGTLLDFLKSRMSLLILDDCEHLIRGCAHFAETALSHAPHLRILATSRESLSITGEVQWRVPSLSLPNPDAGASDDHMTSEAMELFRQRASEVNVGFDLSDENGGTVARICERLDGIPLAIELAAGLCKALSAKDISDRLVDRFSLLTGGSRTALPRQQTLIATMDWSYDLLPEDERYILRQLSVFSGGFSLEGAESIVGNHDGTLNVLNGMVNLVSKSLIVQDQTGPDTRFNLLQTVRQYAAQRLLDSEESAEARNRHLDYFLDRAEAAEPHLHSANQENVVASLELEHDNYRAALDWSLERSADKSIRLTAALWYFWDLHGHLSEGRRWLKSALRKRSSTQTRWEARALMGAGSLGRAQGNLAEAEHFLEEALDVYRNLKDEIGTARALDELGSLAYLKCDFIVGESLCEESLMLYKKHGDLEGVASSLFSMGHWQTPRGQFQQSEALLSECLDLCKRLDFIQGQGAALASLARLRLYLGDHLMASRLASHALGYSSRIKDDWNIGFIELVRGDAAKNRRDLSAASRSLDVSLSQFRRRGDLWGLARGMRSMAAVERLQGNLEPSNTLLSDSIAICRSLGSRWDMAGALEERTHAVLAQERDFEVAITLLGTAQHLRESAGTPVPPCDAPGLSRIAEEAQLELGKERARECWELGRQQGHDVMESDTQSPKSPLGQSTTTETNSFLSSSLRGSGRTRDLQQGWEASASNSN